MIFAVALASAAALAPSLSTNAACYLQQQAVQLSGSGFVPASSYSVMLDSQALGGGTVAADGSLAGTLSSGSLPAGTRQQSHLVSVRDAAQSTDGQVRFYTTALGASFVPSKGDPRTLSVRFGVTGLGAGAQAPARIWLHYLDPRGHLRRTLSLGTTGGPCGSLARSSRISLFPFRTVRSGRWTLQFDLQRDYSSAVQPRITRSVSVR